MSDTPETEPRRARGNGKSHLHPPLEEAEQAKSDPASEDPFTEEEDGETADAEQPAGSIFDDLDALQEDGDADQGDIPEILAYVPVGKPRKGVFFRTHPEWHLTAWIWVAPAEKGQLIGETYFITKRARSLFTDDESALKQVDFVPYITLDGDIGLWPVNRPTTSAHSGGAGWALSAQTAAHQAKTTWIRLLKGMGAYRIFPSQGDNREPKWPAYTFKEILKVGLQDRVIDDAEHEAYRTGWLGLPPRVKA
jgi:hypothetical protein